jgi:NAD(P)H-dependent flavin oxidoreductase YrpB (nitropropane dioxygenase family)
MPGLSAGGRHSRVLTPKPFGINLVLDTDIHDKLEICFDEGVKIVSLFWGAPHNSYIEIVHQPGAIVIHSVGSVPEAKQAVASAVDKFGEKLKSGGCLIAC